jgi:hypothetical protein
MSASAESGRWPPFRIRHLQCFPSIWDHSVIPGSPGDPVWTENAVDSLLAHVLVGEPDSTSPEHALAFRKRFPAQARQLHARDSAEQSFA